MSVMKLVWDTVRRWRARRSTINALSALSDRTLRDIGIDRSEIIKVADELSRAAPRSREVGVTGGAAGDDGWASRRIGREPRGRTGDATALSVAREDATLP